jgi:hypothetical protein
MSNKEAIMKKTDTLNASAETLTWEEESGLLDFLSKVRAEVEKFDSTFDFGVTALPSPPKRIDGKTDILRSIGFVVLRRNNVLGRNYCLYSTLRERALHGYIGVYTADTIGTVRELKPMTDFREGTASLLGWLRELVRASCEKT